MGLFTDPLFGGYDRGYGGLGLPSRLLQIKYKEIPDRVLEDLDSSLLHKLVGCRSLEFMCKFWPIAVLSQVTALGHLEFTGQKSGVGAYMETIGSLKKGCWCLFGHCSVRTTFNC